VSGKSFGERNREQGKGAVVTSCTKVLFIAVDAADKDLIKAWADDGSLPVFSELFRQAAWSVVDNPPGLYVGAVWPSFYTGIGPARHHRYCYEQLRPGSYENYRFHPESDLQAEPFWAALSRADKRVAVSISRKHH